MKLLYIAFARIPTEKAHGLTIAKSCESFARAGADVTLVVPRRATTVQGDVFSAYGLDSNFNVIEIKVPDLIAIFGGNRAVFFLHYLLFFTAVSVRLLFANRKTCIYTRDVFFTTLSILGYQVALECHAISKLREMYFAFARRASHVIVISKALKDSFVAAGFAADEVLVAPSGVDISVFDIDISKDEARRQLDLPMDAKIAVYTGNFTTMGEDKGLNDIISALKEAHDVLFVAVGGSEKDIALYQARAGEAGVMERVILRGHAPQKELAIYQKAADMLLMPFPDTPHYRKHMSPVKMFEYMASGRPIIASDLPTIREVLNDNNTYFTRPGDHKMLARMLEAVYSDVLEAGGRARQALLDVGQFNWDSRSRCILSHLQSAVK